MDIKERILVALGLNEDEELQLAFQAKTEDGTIIVSTSEELKEGVDVAVLTEDGTTIELPVGNYSLDTGMQFRVEEEGKVAEVMAKAKDEDKEEEEEEKEEMSADEAYEKADFEEKKKEEDEEEKKKMKDKKKRSYKEHEEEEDDDVMKAMATRVKKLEDAIEDIMKRMGEKAEEKKMSEETEVKAEKELEELKAENKKLKTELSETPAEAPINTNKFSAEEPKYSEKDLRRFTPRDKYIMNLNKLKTIKNK